MKQKERILFLLDEIKDRVALLQGSDNEVINLDIILEDMRIAYREVELLRLKTSRPTLNEEVNIPSLPPIVAEKSVEEESIINEEAPAPDAPNSFEVPPQLPTQEIKTEDDFEGTNQPIDNLVDSFIDEPPIDLNLSPPVAKLTAKDEVVSNFEKDLNGDKSAQFVADKLRVEDNSLYKKFLLENEDKSIASRLQATPIKSIKDAIGLNEKFLFINELFSGNIQEYNAAIERLNGFDDADAAFEYLNTLGNTCDWNFERSENTIRTLVNLVQRRYMKR